MNETIYQVVSLGMASAILLGANNHTQLVESIRNMAGTYDQQLKLSPRSRSRLSTEQWSMSKKNAATRFLQTVLIP